MASINRRVNGMNIGGVHVRGKYQKLADEVQLPPSPSFPPFLYPSYDIFNPPINNNEINEMNDINNNLQAFLNQISPSDRQLYDEMQNILINSPDKIEAGIRIITDPRYTLLNERMQKEVTGMKKREYKKAQQTAFQLHDNREMISQQLQMAKEIYQNEKEGWNNGTSNAYHQFQQAHRELIIRHQSYQPFLSNFYELRNELAIIQNELSHSPLTSQLKARIKALEEKDAKVKVMNLK